MAKRLIITKDTSADSGLRTGGKLHKTPLPRIMRTLVRTILPKMDVNLVQVTGRYGDHRPAVHQGWDLQGKGYKGDYTPVCSPVNGEVVKVVGYESNAPVGVYDSTSKIVWVQLHLATRSVSPGDEVIIGQQVGTMGSVGAGTARATCSAQSVDHEVFAARVATLPESHLSVAGPETKQSRPQGTIRCISADILKNLPIGTHKYPCARPRFVSF